MISESELVRDLNDYLNVDQIEDDTHNGIQVDADSSIQKVAFAVDARRDIIEKAVDQDADLLVTHHGMIWGGVKSITKKFYKLISLFLKNDMALYVSHLPLDVHEEIGNNVLLAKTVGSEPVDTFFDYNGTEVCLMAEFGEEKKVSEVAKILSEKLEAETTVYLGDRKVKKVGIMTGKGGSAVSLAKEEGTDLFITGERSYMAYNEAIDMGLPLIMGGHYATEILGIQALMEKVEKEYNFECFWIDGRSDI
ncbi:MAG: Nif3-like dinuclear metal center hexameric protein [Candidatus Saliniplasma sp.]